MVQPKDPKVEYEKHLRMLQIMGDSPINWGYAVFGHHFRDDGPSFHEELINSALSNRFLAVVAPRGSAKSTVLAFLFAFHRAVFKKSRFILIVANTFKKASMHLDAMKIEIKTNKVLGDYWPNLSVTKDAEGDSIIHHTDDGFETRIICRGVDQIGSVRGVKFGAYRPDLIIGDDMEDDILVRNPERRRELEAAYDEALIPAGEVHTCRYIMIGTMLHDDCQIAKLVNPDRYTEYKKLFYKARPDEGGLLWPERLTDEFLTKKEQDNPVAYAKEYQNDPVVGVLQRFKQEDLRQYKIQNGDYVLLGPEGEVTGRGCLTDCRAAVSCDLAWSSKREADNTVLMPGLLTPNSEILIWPYIAEKGMRPDALKEHLFTLVDRLGVLTGGPVPVGLEKAMLENVSKYLLKEEMKKRNNYFAIKELVWDADKNTRIETRLQPRYAQNVIYHQSGMGELEHELLRFPSGAHDDLIDAEQGLVQLLQFPKTAKRAPKADDQFERMRNMIIEQKNPSKKAKKRLLTKKKYWVPSVESLSLTLKG